MTKVRMNDLVPFIAIHPSELIKDELKARGIKQKDFARRLGMQPSNFSRMLKNKEPITATFAIKLEEALDIPADFWLRLQTGYERDVLAISKRDEEKKETENVFEAAIKDVSTEIKKQVDLSFAVSDKIYHLMCARGMTQKEFAKKMGKTESEVSVWLSGQHNFTLRTLSKISAFFNEDIVQIKT